jgi:tetratricopeptide (TPR) repeat protein
VAKRTAYRKRQRNAPGRRQFAQQHGPRRVLKPGQSRTTFARKELFIAVGLVALILTVYAQVMNHQFIILDHNRYGALTVAALAILACLTALQVGRWRNSATLFQYTASLIPDNRMIENNLGTILGESGRYDEAAAHFTKALRTKPDFLEIISDADIRGNLGLLLAHQGKLAEAVKQLNEALRLNPNSAEAHVSLGVVLLRLNNAEESIPHFRAAIQLKPNWALAQDNLKLAQKQIDSRRQQAPAETSHDTKPDRK